MGRCCGNVVFASKAAAKEATEIIDFLEGKMLDLRLDCDKNRASEEDYDRRLFVRGLPKDVNDEALYHHFCRNEGEVLSARINLDKETGESKGFGFVVFANSANAWVSLNLPHFLGGRNLDVKMEGMSKPETENDRKRKVFVKGFPAEMNDEGLFKLFADKFPQQISSARVALDRDSGESREFGFVYFEKKKDAKAAAAQAVFVNGRALTMKLTDENNKGKGREDECKLFVTRLAPEVKDEDLYQCFSDACPGVVLSARVVVDRDTGLSRGFRFVFFATTEDVRHAQNQKQPLFLGGRALETRGDETGKGKGKGKEKDTPDLRRLTVRGLSPQTNDESLYSHFTENIGAVEFVRVVLDRDTGASQRFGFITLASLDDAEEATLLTHIIDGEVVDVEGECERDRKLVVRNLPRSLTEEELYTYFTNCVGKVKSAKLRRHDSGESRGCGVVVMTRPDLAKRAAKQMHILDGRVVEVD